MADKNEFVTSDDLTAAIDSLPKTDLSTYATQSFVQSTVTSGINAITQVSSAKHADSSAAVDGVDFTKFATHDDVDSSISQATAITQITSPDGSNWMLGVDNDGQLSTYKLINR